MALRKQFVELGDPVAQQVLKPDDHRGLQAHAERFLDDVEHADAAPVDEGLDVDKAVGVNRKWPEPQRLKP
jgi:hypothetical protein